MCSFISPQVQDVDEDQNPLRWWETVLFWAPHASRQNQERVATGENKGEADKHIHRKIHTLTLKKNNSESYWPSPECNHHMNHKVLSLKIECLTFWCESSLCPVERRVLCNTSVWRTDVCPPCVCLTHTQKDTGRRMEFEALSRHEHCLWEGWRIGWRVCSKKQTKSSELIGSGSVQPFKSFLNR